jgi:hypothetical protein
MNYTDNITYLAQDAGDPEYATDPSFLAQLPYWIMAGEDRILRDLDLLNTYVTDVSGNLSANRRLFTLPTKVGNFVVLATLRVVLPGPPVTVNPPLTWISKEMMDYMFPGDGAVGSPSVPKYIAPSDQTSVLVGPGPDQNYNVRCWGTQRPVSLNAQASLGSLSTGTFISNNFPDLFHAAQMIPLYAWQRQFAPSGDQTDGAVNWNTEYERLKEAADVEEMRKRLSSNGWSSRLPSKEATPPQT